MNVYTRFFSTISPFEFVNSQRLLCQKAGVNVRIKAFWYTKYVTIIIYHNFYSWYFCRDHLQMMNNMFMCDDNTYTLNQFLSLKKDTFLFLGLLFN